MKVAWGSKVSLLFSFVFMIISTTLLFVPFLLEHIKSTTRFKLKQYLKSK